MNYRKKGQKKNVMFDHNFTHKLLRHKYGLEMLKKLKQRVVCCLCLLNASHLAMKAST